MSNLHLYTWHDVESQLSRRREKWASVWSGFDATIDELHIYVRPEVQKDSLRPLVDIFDGRYNRSKGISLESLPEHPRFMKVFTHTDEDWQGTEPPLRPLFADTLKGQNYNPPPLAERPALMAFYSYKGGVGRTLSLFATARLLSKMSEDARPTKLLLVDADYEAPGMTWLVRSEGGFRDFSLIDALALVHSSDDWRAEALPLIAAKVAEETLRLDVDGRVYEHFFLPTFRDEGQLLDLPVRPEHFLQGTSRQWLMTDLLMDLGRLLNVDAVLVDLRAGVSELAAPLLLDPRVDRYLVTSTSSQSVDGTELILRHLFLEKQQSVAEAKTPTILLSMVPIDLDTEILDRIHERLGNAYPIEDGETSSPMLPIVELPFASELVHFGSLGDLDKKLSGSEYEKALPVDTFSRKAPREYVSSVSRTENLNRLVQFAATMTYAEHGEAISFLNTVPLRNLSQKFHTTLPVAVVLGAKGAGKTFTFLQMLRLGRWDAFVASVRVDVTGTEIGSASSTAEVVPMLYPRNLSPQAKSIVERQLLGGYVDLKPAIEDGLEETRAKYEKFWSAFWVRRMATAAAISDAESIEEMNAQLISLGRRITFVVDGLEDYFPHVHTDRNEQVAVQALCQGLTESLRNLANSHIGLVVFVRRDVASAAIPQNFGQFEALYESFELRWDPDEALRLVLWLAVEAHVELAGLGGDVALSIPTMGRARAERELEPLWGKKLGADNANEAYTASWVLAALSDLKGRLQARDLVRLLRRASERSLDIHETDKGFRSDRLLQVSAIKGAIAPCGQEKIGEIEAEIPALKPIFARIRNSDKAAREVPFTRKNFELTAEEVDLLSTQGVVIEEQDGFYTSEIYRQGLGLQLARGARPRVVILQRRALKLK